MRRVNVTVKKQNERKSCGKMSEVCNRKCAMCGNWTRGTEGVVCDNCVEVMNKSLNLTRKDSTMTDSMRKVRIMAASIGAGPGTHCVELNEETSLEWAESYYDTTPWGELPGYIRPQVFSTFLSDLRTGKGGWCFFRRMRVKWFCEKTRVVPIELAKPYNPLEDYFYGMRRILEEKGLLAKDVQIPARPEQSGMTFMEAVEAMKGGKKVRREHWDKSGLHSSIYAQARHKICWLDTKWWTSKQADFEATDWEIVK